MGDIAFLAGRFQPFHKGHLDVAKQGYQLAKKGEYEDFVIGIVNPEPGQYQDEITDYPDSFKQNKNPFTYGERLRMIQNTLEAEGMSDVHIFPFYTYRTLDRAEEKAKFFSPYELERLETLVAEGDWKIETFSEQGVDYRAVEVRKDSKGNEYSGTATRESIGENNDEWRNWVHDEVEKVLDDIKASQKPQFE